MPSTSTCFPMVRGRVLRATRLDGCGRVSAVGCSAIVSEGFVSVAFTANIDAGTEILVTNAAGKTCVRDTPSPTLTGYGVTVTFCEVNPDLYALMTGQATVFDSAGVAVGFRVNSGVDASNSGFALEIWSNVPGVACTTVAAAGTFGYVLVPFIQGGVLGDFTLENNAVTFTLQNAATKTGSLWGTGPYNVVTGASGASKLLTAIGPEDQLHVQLTDVAPPTAGCDCLPSGPVATGAVAGVPGTYTPTGAYPPADFAALVAGTVVASPTTAWTTGQYIVLGDASHAHWSGTAWVAGNA